MMLLLQDVSCIPPNGELLFESLQLSLNRHEKLALIGNNGAGKSTLLKIIAGQITPASGSVVAQQPPYYLPQLFGQFNHLSIAQALGVDQKLSALHDILDGTVTYENLTVLDDDWSLEERCKEALQYWQLDDLNLSQPLATLSGGQKTKVFLAGIDIHQPEFMLLDEPSNHLDAGSRALLYELIQNSKAAMLVVSHDIKLLNLLDWMAELTANGLHRYGGNYDFYRAQKEAETIAANLELKVRQKELRKAAELDRETKERQQKLDARGKKKQEKAGVARIMMNTLRNNAEQSTAKIKEQHTEKINRIAETIKTLRAAQPDIDKMKLGFEAGGLQAGKILFTASDINYSYHTKWLWQENLSFQLQSGDRVALEGSNGSGKTTLIKIIIGALKPGTGTVQRAVLNAVYLDQDYSLIDNRLKVLEQAASYNQKKLPEHELNSRLTHFLFTKDDWDKPCSALSGGERMRLLLCCLTLQHQAPDLIILDEPTNNLDLQNIAILTAAIRDYKGALIVVSHDAIFLEEVGVERCIVLK